MKRMTTLTLLALACLIAMPTIAEGRYRDGMNLYEYVQSRPTIANDPDGLLTVLVHGIDNMDWYPEAASWIHRLKKDETIWKFSWGFHEPKSEISFGRDYIKLNSQFAENMLSLEFPFFNVKEPETVKSADIMKDIHLGRKIIEGKNVSKEIQDRGPVVDATVAAAAVEAFQKSQAGLKTKQKYNEYVKSVEVSGTQDSITKITFTEKGLAALAPFPKHQSITLYAGGLFPDKEKRASDKLERYLGRAHTETIRNRKRKDNKWVRCEPLRVIAFSSGARLLSAALKKINAEGLYKIDTVVLIGASVSKDDTNIANGSTTVHNFYSDRDFITRWIPLGGGAGSFPMTAKGVENHKYNVFHGNWMNSTYLAQFAYKLIPSEERD